MKFIGLKQKKDTEKVNASKVEVKKETVKEEVKTVTNDKKAKSK